MQSEEVILDKFYGYAQSKLITQNLLVACQAIQCSFYSFT